VLLALGRKISTGTLLGALLRQRHALSLRTSHLARRHGFGATTFMVIDAVDRTSKLEGSLLQQQGQTLIGISPINRR